MMSTPDSKARVQARPTGHVRKKSNKRMPYGEAWYMAVRTGRLRPGGGPEQLTRLIGPHWPKRTKPERGFYREPEAKRVLDEFLADIRRGEADLPSEPSGRTFGDAVEEWLRYCENDRGLEETTLRDYRRTGETLISEFGRSTPLEAVDEDRIEAYRAKMLSGKLMTRRVGAKRQKPLSRRSAQKRLVLLGGIFKRAKRKGWIDQDPTTDIEPINLKQSGDFNVLTIEQVDLVARCCDEDLFRAAIVVAAFTGLRTGELRALRWRDVDFGAATIHVRSSKPAGGKEKAPKSDKVRGVPMEDNAARALDGLSRRPNFTQPADRVFASETGDMLGEDAFRDALYAALKKAGIDRKGFPARGGFVFHDLRHTFGTLAVQIWPLSDVQVYMGHADIQTTMRYVHHIPKTSAAREFTDAIERLRKVAEDPIQAEGAASPMTAPGADQAA